MTHKKSHRLILVLLALLLTSSVMVVSGQDTIELQLTWWGSQARHDRTIAVVEMYEAANPGIDIVYTFNSFGDYWTRLNTEAAGGNLACVMSQDYAYLGDWADRGLLMPLDEFIESGVIDTTNIDQAYLDGGKIGDSVYGISLGINTQSFILDAAPEKPVSHSPILVPGQSCWRIESAERTAFLVDGEAYFRAFRDTASRAKHSIMILGWDIDTQVELVREDSPSLGLPSKLGEFLVALLRRRRGLRVYVLNWDYALIYALERQWMPTAEPGWRSHRRLSYKTDDYHPVGASHHQKLVVIDDAVAFVGGLDLSKSRWDTRAHLPLNPRRVDADGEGYAPFHDVQMMVTGNAAAALGRQYQSRNTCQ